MRLVRKLTLDPLTAEGLIELAVPEGWKPLFCGLDRGNRLCLWISIDQAPATVKMVTVQVVASLDIPIRFGTAFFLGGAPTAELFAFCDDREVTL